MPCTVVPPCVVSWITSTDCSGRRGQRRRRRSRCNSIPPTRTRLTPSSSLSARQRTRMLLWLQPILLSGLVSPLCSGYSGGRGHVPQSPRLKQASSKLTSAHVHTHIYTHSLEGRGVCARAHVSILSSSVLRCSPAHPSLLCRFLFISILCVEDAYYNCWFWLKLLVVGVCCGYRHHKPMRAQPVTLPSRLGGGDLATHRRPVFRQAAAQHAPG